MLSTLTHTSASDRKEQNDNTKTMENPTVYKGHNIHYVTNDVAPDTMTACIEMGDGRKDVMTSERIFLDKAAWHADIRAKIDQMVEDAHPTKRGHGPSVLPGILL